MQSRRGFLKIAASVAGLGLIAPLAACAGNGGSNGDGGKTADGKVQINYWHTNPESRGGAAVDSLIKQFNEQSKDVEVVGRYNDGYDGLMKNLQADAAAGNTPDLVQVSYSNLEYFPSTFEFTPADEVAKLAGKDSFIEDQFPENIIKLGTDSEGKLVGFPYAVSDPILYYNKDIYSQAGLTKAPDTWEEVREFAKAIQEKTGKHAIQIQEGDTWALQAMMNAHGGDMLTWNGKKAELKLTEQANVDAMQFYADMVLKDKTALHISNEEALKAFNSGDLAMFAASCANLAGIEKSAKFNIGTVKWPSFEGSKLRIPAGGCVLAVTSSDDAKKKAVMEFIEFLYKDESIVEWIKGTGYIAHTKTAPESDAMKQLLADDPLREAAASAVDNIIPWTAWPGSSAQQAQQFLSDMRDQVLSGSKDPKTALKDCNDKIAALIK